MPITATLSPRANLLRALRHRNFRLFLSGQMISLVGTWMQQVAQSWLIYKLTGSAFLLGVVGFAGQVPALFFGPLGGHVSDRYDRRRVIILTQTLSMVLAFVLAALTLSHTIREWHIIVLASCLGIVNAFDIPVRQAFIVQMVEREDLMNAIALNSSMFNGARIIGPAIAGITVAAIGEGWCFFANGASYIAVIGGLLMMSIPRLAPQSISSSPLANIAAGFRYVKETKPIRALLFLLGLVSFAGMPYTVLMPVFADSILHAGARGLGVLMGASGVGALIGSIALATRRSVRGLGRWVAWASAAFSVSAIAFAWSKSYALSIALLVPLGISMMVQMASSNRRRRPGRSDSVGSAQLRLPVGVAPNVRQTLGDPVILSRRTARGRWSESDTVIPSRRNPGGVERGEGSPATPGVRGIPRCPPPLRGFGSSG
jgi:MFS family permease